MKKLSEKIQEFIDDLEFRNISILQLTEWKEDALELERIKDSSKVFTITANDFARLKEQIIFNDQFSVQLVNYQCVMIPYKNKPIVMVGCNEKTEVDFTKLKLDAIANIKHEQEPTIIMPIKPMPILEDPTIIERESFRRDKANRMPSKFGSGNKRKRR